MPRRRSSADSLPFDTLQLEGSLFVPQLLERAAHGEAPHQDESDYDIPKGLKLHEEYGRAYRIALALWQDFASAMLRKDLDASRAATAFVADLFRDALGYGDLALSSGPVRADGAVDREFPVTAFAAGGRVPVIVAPHSLDLDTPDTRFAILGSGARKKSAHQLAQEFLNASRECLWAFVTNGRTLRLLRDADTLTRPNFLEFDLDTILRQGEDRYADFSALWRILHASRAGGGSAVGECVWEKWKATGHAEGTRIRNGLSAGVTQTLLRLGTGFLSHLHNQALRQRIDEGTLSREDFFQQLLRLVYRWLFLFCAEERDLLHEPLPHDPDEAEEARRARRAYADGYSLRRLRSRCLRQFAHDIHGDLWIANRIVFAALARGEKRLALPALGGLFSTSQCPDLDSASLANRDLLASMRELRWFFDKKSGQRSAVDYRNMGPEELGSVYESLLELVPQIDLPARQFGFAGITDDSSTSGNARKTSGSYYTPDSLVQELIKSALEPVIRQRLADARDLAARRWHEVVTVIAADKVKLSYVTAFLEKHADVPDGASPDALGRAWEAMPVHERENPLCAEALLHLTVCDPSCGSGHFLLAAARRLAESLAELRAPDGAVRPHDYRHALRDVASRCLFGVDLNPMAVELCRVALWLETVDPGRPLGFLDHHIRCGNSLLGTTPELIAAGLPDGAFKAIEGDDKAACAELKKRNKKEREGFGPLFEKQEQALRDRLRLVASAVEDMDESDLAHRDQKEAEFRKAEATEDYRRAKLLADLWCAAFVIKKRYPNDGGVGSGAVLGAEPPPPVEGELLHTQEELFGQPAAGRSSKFVSKKQHKNKEEGTPFGITTVHFHDFAQGKPLPTELQNEVEVLARQYRFFHWHLAFPQVFEKGGFECILGNPPWDSILFREEEFFSSNRPDIANASTAAARKQLIASLEHEAPPLFYAYRNGLREVNAINGFVRASQRYPLCGIGRVNLFALFAECARTIASNDGRVGQILPSGIATDDSTKLFFQSVIDSGQLVSFFDFENREAIFQSVHRSYRFSIVTLRGGISTTEKTAAKFVFFATRIKHLDDANRCFTLSAEEINQLNPETKTCPIFRTPSDAELTKAIYRRLPVLSKSDWDPDLRRFLNSADDSRHFLTQAGKGLIPLYEGKYFHHYDHRWITRDGRGERQIDVCEKVDPMLSSYTRYWFPNHDAKARFGKAWKRSWVFAWRDIARTTDERSFISAVVPSLAIPDTAKVILVSDNNANQLPSLIANLGSFAFDFVARQKVGGIHMSAFIVAQLPVVTAASFTALCPWVNNPKSKAPNPQLLQDWLLPRVLELTYTAWDLEPFAADCGWPGAPFRWDEERRFLLRCELDAAFFHLYLGGEGEWCQQPENLTRAFPTPRDAVGYIMETFPIVKRKDEAKHGSYRTKDTILQIYDSLAEAIATGIPYKTLLDPPPASFRVAHPPRLPAVERSDAREAEDIFLMFVIQFVRQSWSEATLPLLSQVWHRFADLTRYRTELSGILSESQFTAWQESHPVTRTRQGFHEFVSDLVGSLQLDFDDSSLVISFCDDAFNDMEGDPWIRTEVSLSLLLLAHHPDVEQWLPGTITESESVRLASLHEFHLIA